MKPSLLTLLSLLSHQALAVDDPQPHGLGEEGRTMGPVAFMWPSDREWNAANDNSSPCGSAKGVTNRTQFPLSQGSVALAIADDAWNVAFRISYKDDPKSQSDFGQQIVHNISEVNPGHSCYKISEIPTDITAGTNATIQLEYWSEFEGENNGNNESFFACADVTLVEPQAFTLQIPCFNVTSADFVPPSSLPSSKLPATTMAPSTPASTSAPFSSSSPGGLSTGAKAGVAVGTIVGSFATVGLVAWLVVKRRKGAATGVEEEARDAYTMKKTASEGTRE
ncbi:hypothetical protein GQ43DRAFT_459757 [Delitschia confertaspora ATCC 74209]|uniref:Copper acquisition factor BIM1-like domain-containing protein n=1 Tax=Delitschia confertaspora ATCC 74209 TaxID=1513339 RepID=A0A9P4N3D4_9PLEO|nr:hypothetical protein GQ43DRAFT_459757 [Delitschia confertaspora ATCC 74209]